MSTVHLLLGTNMGDRLVNLEKARTLLGDSFVIAGKSSIYETEPWGLADQDTFLNQAVAIETDLEARDVMAITQTIEKKVGRTPLAEKWGPRIMDIDILLAGHTVLSEADLTIPHPNLHERRFALEPLNDIAPQAIHPVLGNSIEKILVTCLDKCRSKALDL